MNSTEKKIPVSACIVSYNNQAIIAQAIHSVLDHTKGVDLELYIYDNASTDRTVEVIKEEFQQVWLMQSKKNRGFGSGHNKVLPKLTSKYHVIINPDILLQSDAITEIVSYMEEHPDVHLAVPRFLNADGSEQFTPKLTPKFRYMLGGRLEKHGGIFKRWRDEYTLKGQDITEPIDVGFCSGCFMVIRTETFRQIGGFDPRYFLYNEDADLTRSVKEVGRAVYIPSVSVVHLWERAYMKKNKYLCIQIQSMLKYFWKWRGRLHEE